MSASSYVVVIFLGQTLTFTPCIFLSLVLETVISWPGIGP